MLLDQILRETPYASYSYSYPHKTAYRPLPEPVKMRDVWAGERRDALFLYLHVPFCEMRCGFCNLFTTANPQVSLETQYLQALEREARQVRDALGPVTISRMAIGGGTPTYLDMAGLNRVFDITAELFGAELGRIPISVETSPGTSEAAKMTLLQQRGVDRVSIGVQSFHEAEAAAVGRGQKTAEVEAALTRIREAGIATLNIDLMYGLPGQTAATWLSSLEAALRFQPEELYLYPLYVRPLTGLGRVGRAWDDQRLELYRLGRDFLRSSGYTQVSMRMFRAAHAPDAGAGGPIYCCQDDGMVGLGCGARSYTTALHYSSEYAVGRTGVKSILADYIAKPADAFDWVAYGAVLDAEEQRRRYVLQLLLQAEGLNGDAYHKRFGSDWGDDLPQLAELTAQGLTELADGHLRLTEWGMERSDTLGPWLYSAPARRLMEAYDLR